MTSNRVKEVTRGELTGSGFTKTEATADLETQLDQALQGSYTPMLIRAHGETALVWRELDGWFYRILSLVSTAQSSRSSQVHGCGTQSHDAAAVERQARHHLAQVVFAIGGPTGLSVIREMEDRREHVEWCRYKYAYQAWRDVGVSDLPAHESASWDQWPEGVEPVDVEGLPD